MLTRRIEALANEGIECLHRGHYKSAIFALRHALACLKANFEEEDNDSGAASASDPFKMLTSLHAPLFLMDQREIQKMSMHNSFDVYAFSFEFFYDEADPNEFYNEITMGLFYNLGLAHHFAGLSDISMSRDHLMEALSYYKFSFALYQSQDCHRFATWFPFSLGLLNNMGHVFCHFCMGEEMRACRSEMKLLLVANNAPLLTFEEEAFFATSVYCSGSFALAPSA